MANFNLFKTAASAYWAYVNGVPAWRLNNPTNVWDALMDAIGAAVASFVPYSPAGVTVVVTLGASPATVTAGTSPEVHYISDGGGSVNSVKRHGQILANGLPLQVLLPPGGTYVIDYSGTPPLVVKDY